MTEKKCCQKIRNASKEYRVPLWKVADLMGVSYETIMRRLRHELPETEQDRIVKLIADYAEGAES